MAPIQGPARRLVLLAVVWVFKALALAILLGGSRSQMIQGPLATWGPAFVVLKFAVAAILLCVAGLLYESENPRPRHRDAPIQ